MAFTDQAIDTFSGSFIVHIHPFKRELNITFTAVDSADDSYIYWHLISADVITLRDTIRDNLNSATFKRTPYRVYVRPNVTRLTEGVFFTSKFNGVDLNVTLTENGRLRLLEILEEISNRKA